MIPGIVAPFPAYVDMGAIMARRARAAGFAPGARVTVGKDRIPATVVRLNALFFDDDDFAVYVAGADTRPRLMRISMLQIAAPAEVTP